MTPVAPVIPVAAAGGPWLAVSAGICRSRRLGGLTRMTGGLRRMTGRLHRMTGRLRRMTGRLRRRITEQLLDPMPPLFHPVQRQAEFGDGVADLVVGLLAGQPDQDRSVLRLGLKAAPCQFRQQLACAVLDLDDQDLARLSEAG